MAEALTTIFPGYFPDISTFRRIVRASTVLVLDDRPARSTGNWTRAAVKTAEGKRYLTVPTHIPGNKPPVFLNLAIDFARNWKKKHRHSLWVNYKNAPYFEHYWPRFETFFETPFQCYIPLFLNALTLILDILHHSPRLRFSSELSTSGSRETQILELLEREGLRTYVIEKAHTPFFNCAALESRNVFCEVVEPPSRPYPQQFGEFLPNLSILDLIFNLGPEAVFYLKET